MTTQKVWVVDDCIECPALVPESDGKYYCDLECQEIDKVWEEDFPDWCPLSDL